ncbi:hypothetical protein Plhal703r1_c46g0148271 [Plasmopara halstedii]
MSSGFAYPQPIFISPIYNPAFYLSLDASGYLTYQYAQTLYLSKDDYRLTYIAGIVPGVATASKALVLDSTRSCTNIYGMTFDSGGTGIDTPGLKFGGITFDQSLYLSITQGAATASKAVVLNASKDITGLGYVSGATMNATSLVSGTAADFGALSIGGSQVISSARNLLNIGSISATDLIKSARTTSGQTFSSNCGTSVCALYSFLNGAQYLGTTSTHDFVLQSANLERMRITSTGNITITGDLTASGTITAGTLAGFLSYGNQTAITTVGPLTELGINCYNSIAYLELKGAGTAYLDGSYTRMCRFVGSNLTPCEFQIEVHNGSNGTTTNASWIGNISSTDLRFGTGNATTMILTAGGRLGLGTTTPSAPLSVVNAANFTFGAGSSTVYRLRTDSGVTESALGPIVYSVAANFGGYIAYVKLYEWIESENRQGQEVGLVAQDLVSAHLTDLISIKYRDDIEEGEDPSLEPAKQQLNVDYSRIAAYNMKMIQHLLTEVEDLKAVVSEIHQR